MIIVVIAAAWFGVALVVALVVCSTIRFADRRAPLSDRLVELPEDLTVDDILGSRQPQSTTS